VFDVFGPLPLEVRQEDAVIPFRSLVLGDLVRIQETLVLYRLHGSNLSLEYKHIANDERELQDLYATEFRQQLSNLRCYLRDLEIARRYIEKGRWESLRRCLQEMINQCELEIAFRHGGLGTKLGVLMRGIGSNVGMNRVAKWTFRTLLPGVYARSSYVKYRRKLKPDLLFDKDSGESRRL
jgi:hypothetical protein